MLVVSPQLLGGVFPWTVAIICLMAGITGLLTSRRLSATSSRRTPAQLLDWAMFAAWVWTAFQLVPLPPSVISLFVPESLEAWRASATLLDRTQRSWVPLSLDPGATVLELAKGSAILVAYLAARAHALSERRDWVLAAVGISAATMALVALGHRLANATQVFGLYEPVYAGSRLLAPLMNENHLAGFMALAVPVLVGLAIDANRRELQIAWGLSALSCAIVGVLTFSRGGIGALGLGLGIFAAGSVLRSRDPSSPRHSMRAAVVGASLLLGVGVVVALTGDALKQEFSHTHNRMAKFEAAEAAFPMVADHWLTGVGRGAFSVAFAGEHGGAKRFFYPENLLVQWTSEWGLVVGLGLLLLISWSLARSFSRVHAYATLGGVAGLAALGVQQLVDFSLELVGVAVVAAATLGAVGSSVITGRLVSVRCMLLVSSALAIGGAGAAGALHERDTATLERALTASLARGDLATTQRLVEEGLSLHPAEPTFVLVGAELALRSGDPATGPWINRAQQLAPGWSAPHLLAARWLSSIGKTDQALVELRAGEEKHPGSMVQLMCSLLEHQPSLDLVLRVTPPGIEGGLFLDRVARCLPWSDPLAAEIDVRALDRDPGLNGPTLRQARRMTLAGNSEGVIAMLEARPSLDSSSTLILAEAYLRDDQAGKAQATIAPFLETPEPSERVLRVAIAAAIASGRDADVDSLASRLRSRANGRIEPIAEVDLYIGDRYEAEGRMRLALAAYRRANRVQESRRSLESVARASNATGDTVGAILAYRTLCRKSGGSGPACVSAQELERTAKPAP